MVNFCFSEAGREWNEDRVFVCDKYGFVIDGATVITGEHYTDFGSDAEWFADVWAKYLSIALADGSKSIKQIIEDEVEVIAEQYKRIVGSRKVTSFPSASVSIVRERGDVLEVYALADSPILIQTFDGRCFYFADTRNNINDAVVMAQISKIAQEKNAHFLETKKENVKFINEGRLKDNAFGGAYVLKNDKFAVEYGFYYEIPKNLVKKVVIMSDGYSEILELFHLMTETEFLNNLNTVSDAKKFYERLRKAQLKDRHCDKFIRMKVSDDASVVCMFE